MRRLSLWKITELSVIAREEYCARLSDEERMELAGRLTDSLNRLHQRLWAVSITLGMVIRPSREIKAYVASTSEGEGFYRDPEETEAL